MSQAKKHEGVFNLEAEIEIRRRVSAAFDGMIDALASDLSGSPSMRKKSATLDALAVMLDETRAQIKQLQKQEDQLKSELRKFFPDGSRVLDLPSSVVLLEPCSRSGLDKDRLLDDHGPQFVLRYTKTTNYEKLSVKRKA